MARQVYALNKDYAIYLESKNRRLTAQHGLIECTLKLTYWYNKSQDGIEECEGFGAGAIKALKSAGWYKNYLESDMRVIFNEVTKKAEFINEADFSYDTHIKAIL